MDVAADTELFLEESERTELACIFLVEVDLAITSNPISERID